MTAKAGPKKRRAKAEEAALRAAIEENKLRGKQVVTRRATKLRSYNYKNGDRPKPSRKLSLDPTAEGLNDRNARSWQPWEEAIMFVEDGNVLDALAKHQLSCPHEALKGEKPVAIRGADEYRVCPSCQAVLRWWGNYTATIRAEWQSLRITGYDPMEWGEMFTKDKSLWIFMLEEAHAALSDEEVPNE